MQDMSALSSKTSDTVNIFLIGNNPTDLGWIYKMLKSIKNRTFRTEIHFDLSNVLKKISQFNPACILIDDNLERLKLIKLVRHLNNHVRTRHIPITVIKNSNYNEASIQEAQDFLLKDSLTSDTLDRSIFNSIRFKRMQRYLTVNYKQKKNKLNQFLKR